MRALALSDWEAVGVLLPAGLALAVPVAVTDRLSLLQPEAEGVPRAPPPPPPRMTAEALAGGENL